MAAAALHLFTRHIQESPLQFDTFLEQIIVEFGYGSILLNDTDHLLIELFTDLPDQWDDCICGSESKVDLSFPPSAGVATLYSNSTNFNNLMSISWPLSCSGSSTSSSSSFSSSLSATLIPSVWYADVAIFKDLFDFDSDVECGQMIFVSGGR
ncbi:unnamed protein product [Clonostachys rosea f. rosea IK726]|uniref:Uncharacterized protein n=1 Tax=Clonostachys rosea f. rosea IK726 TaxID=1349383 RepID=A0ACA9U3R4_BIOOC|nr:unnamed protein product [Clonostachys rosea f. rosea IK726]